MASAVRYEQEGGLFDLHGAASTTVTGIDSDLSLSETRAGEPDVLIVADRYDGVK